MTKVEIVEEICRLEPEYTEVRGRLYSKHIAKLEKMLQRMRESQKYKDKVNRSTLI